MGVGVGGCSPACKSISMFHLAGLYHIASLSTTCTMKHAKAPVAFWLHLCSNSIRSLLFWLTQNSWFAQEPVKPCGEKVWSSATALPWTVSLGPFSRVSCYALCRMWWLHVSSSSAGISAKSWKDWTRGWGKKTWLCTCAGIMSLKTLTGNCIANRPRKWKTDCKQFLRSQLLTLL